MRELMPEHDPSHPERDRTGVIFAECQIRYRSPVVFDEIVGVECSIGEIRRSAFEVRFTMRVDDRVAAEGSGWLVAYDYEAGRSQPLPDDLRGALEEAAAEPGARWVGSATGRVDREAAVRAIQVWHSNTRMERSRVSASA